MSPSRVVFAWVAIGFVLRLARPQIHSFWIDEGMSVLVAQSDDLLGMLRGDNHPPLSFLAWRAWAALFGWSDLALRLLPAVTSCLSLVLFTLLARAWVGERRLAWVVALYAAAPLLVWIAHEVRMYAFVELSALLVMHAARAAWRRPAFPRFGVLAACTALATGLHYYASFAGLIVIAQALVRRRSGALSARSAGATVAASALGVAVWTPWFVTILPAQHGNDWPRIAGTGWRALAELPVRLVAVDLVVLQEHALDWIGWVLACACALGLAAWTVFVAVRAREERDASSLDRATGPAEALCAALVPVGAALAAALAFRGGFQARYLVPAVPGTIACIAGGLCVLRPLWVARTAGAAAIGGALLLCWLQLAENRREDYRSACREIAERWHSGDRLLVVCCVPQAYVMSTVAHYLRERPDVLAGALDVQRYLDGDERVPAGTRIHVLWREATMCWEPFDRVRRTHRFVEVEPPRFRIHRILAEAP